MLMPHVCNLFHFPRYFYAHVISFTGVMKLDDLKHVFKSSAIGPVDTRGYIVSLLNKFEVALTWDSRTLLIPSLLPCEDDLQLPSTNSVRVKVLCRKYYCMTFWFGWYVQVLNKDREGPTCSTVMLVVVTFSCIICVDMWYVSLDTQKLDGSAHILQIAKMIAAFIFVL